jgi:hypothetical protein
MEGKATNYSKFLAFKGCIQRFKIVILLVTYIFKVQMALSTISTFEIQVLDKIEGNGLKVGTLVFETDP